MISVQLYDIFLLDWRSSINNSSRFLLFPWLKWEFLSVVSREEQFLNSSFPKVIPLSLPIRVLSEVLCERVGTWGKFPSSPILCDLSLASLFLFALKILNLKCVFLFWNFKFFKISEHTFISCDFLSVFLVVCLRFSFFSVVNWAY